MLLTKEVEVEVSGRAYKYYANLGYEIPKYYNKNKNKYFIKKGTKIKVQIEDLQLGSRIPVDYLCDYCLENGIKTVLTNEYNVYLRFKNKGQSGKDCCKKCSPIKQQENFQLEYGVSHQMYLDEVKNKVSNGLKKPYEELVQDFKNKGYILTTNKETWQQTGIKHVNYICKKHWEIGEQEVNLGHFYDRVDNCKQCLLEHISAENSHRWKGGISPLQQYFRKKIESWKIDSMKSCNYKCVITGKSFNIIHHLYSFTSIITEVLYNLNLPIYKEINRYSDDELNYIEEECLKLHYKYPLGVCLTNEMHKLFHKVYGTGNNIPSQFEDFKNRLKSGEFDLFLKENNYSLII